MAFIIPMLGKSSRFFNEGYLIPKYQLKISGKSALCYSILSFKRYFNSDLFIFLVRSDYGAYEFVQNEVVKCGVQNYKIKIIEFETKGQAETVSFSLDLIKANEPVYIFNIDTFREDYLKPDFVSDCDGYLEVFNGTGEAWSFILPGKNNQVIKTTEKDRISNFCSDGLYYFKNKAIYSKAFENSKNNNKTVNGEYYIAPLYNDLILSGMDVRYDLIDITKLKFFGTPKEYLELLEKLK